MLMSLFIPFNTVLRCLIIASRRSRGSAGLTGSGTHAGSARFWRYCQDVNRPPLNEAQYDETDEDPTLHRKAP
jgi:hypothetical protein